MVISTKQDHIIKSYKFIGLNFYEKKRLFENKINISFEAVNCDNIGLYVIGKFPRIKYNNFAYSENLSWETHAISTIRLSIFNLINNGSIEIIKAVDSKSYLFSLIKNKKIDYYFNTTDLNVDKDWFLTIVYDAINVVNKNENPSLYNYVRIILDEILQKNSSHNNPARSFLVSLLKNYAKLFPWIDISTKKKYFGIYKDYNIKVEEIYIPKINMQHQSLVEIEDELIYKNQDYKDYCYALKQEIEKDFSRREPSDSNLD